MLEYTDIKKFCPYDLSIITSGIIIAFSLALLIFDFNRLFIRGSHFFFGSMLFLIYLFLCKFLNSSSREITGKVSNDSSYILTLYFVLFSAGSVVASSTGVRPRLYFIMIILMLFCNALYINSISLNRSRVAIAIVAVCITYLHLAYSLTLKYPYYFGKTDGLYHANLASRIYQSGRLPEVIADGTLYGDFPLWHLLVTMQKYIMNLGWATSRVMLLLGGVTGVMVIFGCFALGERVLNRTKISLYFALFAAANPTVVYFTSYSIPRSAIMGLLIVLFLLTALRPYKRAIAPIALIIVSMIFYHPSTPPFLLIMLLVISILSRLIHPNSRSPLYVSRTIITFFAVTTALVWIFTSNILPTYIELSITSAPGGDLRAPNLNPEFGVIVDRLYYAPLLALVLIGYHRSTTSRNWNILNIRYLSIIGFGLYFISAPGPLSLIDKFLSSFNFSRWPQYTFPFTLLLASIGYISLQDKNHYAIRIFKFIVLLSIITISISGYTVAPDNPLADTDRRTGYFTESETAAFNRISMVTNGPLYVDRDTAYYYPSRYRAEKTRYLRYNTESGNLDFPRDGLVIYRERHAKDRSVRVGVTDGPFGQFIQLKEFNSRRLRGIHNQVYSSGSVVGLRYTNTMRVHYS